MAAKLPGKMVHYLGDKGQDIARRPYNSPLTGRMMMFARLVADGLPVSEAYRSAGYQCDGHGCTYIANHAYIVAQNPKVAAEIDRLRKAQGAVSTWSRNEMIDMLHHIAVEAYEQSHPVTATETDEDGHTQEVIIRKYDAPSAAVALKAIEQAAKMCGYNEPEQVQQTVTVEVLGGDGLDD